MLLNLSQSYSQSQALAAASEVKNVPTIAPPKQPSTLVKIEAENVVSNLLGRSASDEFQKALLHEIMQLELEAAEAAQTNNACVEESKGAPSCE